MFHRLRQKLKGWKTLIAARLYLLAGALLTAHDVVTTSGVDFEPLVPPRYWPYVLVATGLLFELLRRATTTPLGKKAGS